MDASTQRRLIERAAKYNLILLLLGLCVRPFILPVDWVFASLALLSIAFYGCSYYLIRRGKIRKYAGFALFVSTYSVLVLFLAISGGIHGHLVYLLPLGPVFASLVLSERSSWVITLITVLLIMFLGLFVPEKGELLAPVAALPKMVWLILSVFVGAGFARFFAKENKSLADALKHQAHMDFLTGVLNRRGMEGLLKREVQLAKAYSLSLSIFMVDLDYFKKYNDFNGHLAGDECLSKVSLRLDQLVRAQSGSIGRYGGEEFIIVLSDRDQDFINNFAHALRGAVKDMAIPLKKGQVDVLTASVGYCYCETEDIVEVERMISKADAKLYQCKAKGRDCVLGDVSTKQTVDLSASYSKRVS